MASVIRSRSATFTTDTSTFDVEVSSEVGVRNPTGCIVIASYAEVVGTTAAHHVLSCGVTDFTTTACCASNDEDGINNPGDSYSVHNETDIINLTTPGIGTTVRSATVAAKSGGVTFTPGESGTAYKFQVILIFGAACHAFSSQGSGSMGIDDTFDITHGLGVKPNAGFYFGQDNYNGGTADAILSIGLHADTGSIVQRCLYMRSRSNNTNSITLGTIATNRVSTNIGNAGAENSGYELTTNDATKCTYTNRIGANTSEGLIGLLVDFDDVDVLLATVDTPTTPASDWNYNGTTFTPQFVYAAISPHTTEGTVETSGDGGVVGITAWDTGGAEHTTSVGTEDGLVLSSVVSHTWCSLNAKIFGTDDAETTLFDLDDPTFTTDGFDFAADDIITMNGTSRKWPMLLIEEGTGGGGIILNSSNHKNKLLNG